MTKNEFIFCCELLYKHYKGKKLNGIIKTSKRFADIEIENMIYENDEFNVKFRNNKNFECIVYFMKQQLKLNGKIGVDEFNYDKVEDFLKAVKIPLEDIV